jgi:hypothetical protein
LGREDFRVGANALGGYDPQMRASSGPFSRRAALKTIAGFAAGAVAGRAGSLVGADRANLVHAENTNGGTREWMLGAPRIDPKTKYRCPWIEGYCSRTSVRAGEAITFHISANPACMFTIEIFRLGYYGGTGGRRMKRLGPFVGVTQPEPIVGAKRVRDCAWEPCAELRIPNDWVSGIYVGKLTAAQEGVQSYIIFIVRDNRRADFIFQCSDTTWQAYNRWPTQFALYDDGWNTWYWGGGVQVSFNRPYGKYCQILDQPLSTGSGEFLLWEFPFVFWLESLGFDVTYISNLDTHHDPHGLLRAAGFLSVGHDEYWSIEMFENVKNAIANGINVGFFSGNAVCGRILFDERVKAFERVGVFGPPGGTQDFIAMESLEHARPYAHELVGAQSTGPVTGGADWICTRPDHWIYHATGMKEGDRIPGLIGWEWHGDPAPIPGLEIVATGATQSAPDKPNGGTYTATVYPGPRGNFVFNAATCWWADGLSAPPGYVRPKVYTEPKGPDRRVQEMTKNILERMRLSAAN